MGQSLCPPGSGESYEPALTGRAIRGDARACLHCLRALLGEQGHEEGLRLPCVGEQQLPHSCLRVVGS